MTFLGLLFILIILIMLLSSTASSSYGAQQSTPVYPPTTNPHVHDSSTLQGYILGKPVEPTVNNLSNIYFMWTCANCRLQENK